MPIPERATEVGTKSLNSELLHSAGPQHVVPLPVELSKLANHMANAISGELFTSMYSKQATSPLQEVYPEAQQTVWKKKDDIASYYSCDVRTITNLMRRRVLPFVKIGRIVRFDVQACDEAMRRYQRRSVAV